MPAPSDAAGHPGKMAFGGVQPSVPDPHLEALVERRVQEPGHRVSSEGGLEGEVLALRDGVLEQSFALLPGASVRCCLAQRRGGSHDASRRLVGIEVVRLVSTQSGPTDAALASTIGPGEDGNAGRS